MPETAHPAKDALASVPPHPVAAPHTGPARGPEWPRLTSAEMRRIVRDILG